MRTAQLPHYGKKFQFNSIQRNFIWNNNCCTYTYICILKASLNSDISKKKRRPSHKNIQTLHGGYWPFVDLNPPPHPVHPRPPAFISTCTRMVIQKYKTT